MILSSPASNTCNRHLFIATCTCLLSLFFLIFIFIFRKLRRAAACSERDATLCPFPHLWPAFSSFVQSRPASAEIIQRPETNMPSRLLPQLRHHPWPPCAIQTSCRAVDARTQGSSPDPARAQGSDGVARMPTEPAATPADRGERETVKTTSWDHGRRFVGVVLM